MVDNTRSLVVGLTIVYAVFLFAMIAAASGWIVGVEPRVSWIPAWTIVLYVIMSLCVLFHFWVMDYFDEYLVGEDLPTTVRGRSK